MKNIITTSWLVSGLLLVPPAAQAQVRFSVGPRLGLNVATALYQSQGYTYVTGYRSGLEAGLAGSLGLGHFAVQPAVLYSQKGFTIHNTASGTFQTTQRDDSYRFHYLTLPVSIAFVRQADGQGLQAAVGGYVSFLLGGKFQGATTYYSNGSYYTAGGTPIGGSQTINYAGDVGTQSSATTFYSNGTDAGLQGSLGYRYAGVLLQVGYSLGLRDLGYKSTFGNTYYNRAFQASLTYLLGPRG